MTQGFIKFYREKGKELLESDPQAFLLLAQIAIRARRTDAEYSRVPLKANQAFLGDHEKAGLSRQQYRDVQKRLARYDLAMFKPTNKGTIATLTSTAVYDINAEETTPSDQPANPSMKTQESEPTKNQPTSTTKPMDSHRNTNEEPLTRREEREECKRTTTTSQQGAAALYQCLQDYQQLPVVDKQSLMIYPEDRVLKAIEWSLKATIKKTLIQALHWHCKQESPPQPTVAQVSQTRQQIMAWEHNQFLEECGYAELAQRNREAILQDHMWIMENGKLTTVTLKGSLEVLQGDFQKSKQEIMRKKS